MKTLKRVVVGDSYTYIMSNDPRVKYSILAHQQDDLGLYPDGWVAHYFDPDGETLYCWTFSLTAWRLDQEGIEKMLNSVPELEKLIDSKTTFVFSFGGPDFYSKLADPDNLNLVVNQYFDTVYQFCEKNNLRFKFSSPVSIGPTAYLIDDFNHALAELCNNNGSGSVITYPDSIPYNTFEPFDKYNHASDKVMHDVANYIKTMTVPMEQL